MTAFYCAVTAATVRYRYPVDRDAVVPRRLTGPPFHAAVDDVQAGVTGLVHLPISGLAKPCIQSHRRLLLQDSLAQGLRATAVLVSKAPMEEI